MDAVGAVDAVVAGDVAPGSVSKMWPNAIIYEILRLSHGEWMDGGNLNQHVINGA